MTRPREYDRKEIAQKMLEWAEKEDSINLCGFAAEVRIPSGTMLRWTQEDDQFRETYETVRDMIGARRERLLSQNKLHVKAYDLNAKTYDANLRDQHRKEFKYEVETRSKAAMKEKEQEIKNLSDLENWQKSQDKG